MKNIAIIGSGISGLTAAHLINQKHHVTVFEKNDYIGGHTATKPIKYNNKEYKIDTGFIVCNDRTYPNFLKLLDKLGVPKQKTQMSFSVKNNASGLEYNGHDINTLFAQRRNFLKPSFWKLIKEILKFNKLAINTYENTVDEDKTLGDFLLEHHFSDNFCENYILPMGAAIWSSSLKDMLVFPLQFFVQFFYNHGLLSITNRPQWYVITGGSYKYIDPLTHNFKNKIKLNSKIDFVERTSKGIEIHFKNGEINHFDEVIFACHSDEALALLKSPSEQEQEILSNIPYTPNEVVLHTDTDILPKRKAAWASWNYLLDENKDARLNKPSCVTYNMNILQGIVSKDTFCVTLNQTALIDKNKIIDKYTYHHPVFNNKSFIAQKRRSEICGKKHTHFVGAYWRNGFHEDGVHSALSVAKRFGVTL
ncbi:FAD-dependent oxidoreductase [Pseudoalteromonas sp. C2R02]|uniref:NAD(P)/FAD-dependent oxidoreductase n=1 Tax=Pseudoalteromonas sp. C2R02 TaxID=2841565 RepID=UPI001C09DCC8|nr:FAD-dependent oxidoreductase [Pseudoalteromonas sp. C2R02]MBU2967958.1 FAD-dependent oxidoreductase [Pseudoalteromonas sp. C2R02]